MRILSVLLTAVLVFCEVYSSERKSWIDSANDSLTDFPIQNLPYGIFKKKESNESQRVGVAIGNYVLDLTAAIEENIIQDIDPKTISALKGTSLNAFMALCKSEQNSIRQKIMEVLDENTPTLRDSSKARDKLLIPLAQVDLLLPFRIGDYTDFYASIHHATHVGSIMRPDNPLMPNYKHMPIGYHGRSSSVTVSGTEVQWPKGQILGEDGKPMFSLSQSMDYELEVGAVIGKGNMQGHPIAIDEAGKHIFGYVLLNDWSARDIQKWEYQPLGPFNGKNFATTISPWVVTTEALEPYRMTSCARPSDDPLLDYLAPSSSNVYEIVVEAYLSSDKMRKMSIDPIMICQGNLKDLYWTFDQMVTHHTCSGCNLNTGDLLGSGTISGPTLNSLGCFLERKAFKVQGIELPDGTFRQFLQDGDQIVLRAFAKKEGYPKIGFGECVGIIVK